jgi:hypothetical protein
MDEILQLMQEINVMNIGCPRHILLPYFINVGLSASLRNDPEERSYHLLCGGS